MLKIFDVCCENLTRCHRQVLFKYPEESRVGATSMEENIKAISEFPKVNFYEEF